MSSNGVPIQEISDTVGHKSTHVTETVYRHVIVPAIRGGATVMDGVFTDDEDDTDEGNEKTRALRQSARRLTIEHRSGKPVELRGFEPLTFCMPCMQVSSDGVALGPVTAVQSGFSVWGRLVRSGEIGTRWSLVWYWIAGPPVIGGASIVIRITGDAMTLEIGSLVVATARFSEHAAADGNGA